MKRTICLFGDSITWGVEDRVCGGWADRLKTWMYMHDRLADVYNLGISANTSSDVLARFEAEAQARRPDTVVFAIGINDSIWLVDESRSKTSLEQFEQNMHALIEQAHNIAERVICLGITRVDESKTMPVYWNDRIHMTNDLIRTYDQVIAQVCQTKQIEYLPLFDLLEDADLPDGLHPNAEGHEKMFERIKSLLQSDQPL